MKIILGVILSVIIIGFAVGAFILSNDENNKY